MNTTYPRILAAVRKSENSLWEIGDAIIAECGKDGPLSDVSKYLAEQGYEYSTGYLGDIRNTAQNFRKSDREFDLAWGVYRVAGTPEVLRAVVAAAKGKKFSQIYIEKIRAGQHMERKALQREAAEKARIEREAAEAREAEARRKAREAKDKAERIEAEKKAQEAAKRTREARLRERKTKVAPPRGAMPVKPEEVPSLEAKVQVSANASQAVRLAREAEKAIRPHVSDLTAAAAAGMVDACLQAANAWTDLAHLVGKQHGEYEHLAVVGD
jgi:hypothetical protein